MRQRPARRHLAGILAGALAAVASIASAADRALIVTARDYASLPDAPETRSIAFLGYRLQELGFEVRAFRDPRAEVLRGEMGRAVDALAASDRLVILVSGHVVHNSRDAWMLTTDASVLDPFAAGAAGVSIGALVDIAGDVAKAHPGRVIVAVADSDARLEPRLGLADGFALGAVPEGVALLAGPPRLLARFLDEELLVPGRSVAGAMRRAPAAIRARGAVSSRPFLPADNAQDELEESFWRRTVEADSIEGYRDYLRLFPEGRHVEEARARLAVLEETPQERARRLEAELDLTRNQRRDIQRDLKHLGYYDRAIDGIFGRGTRSAIARWQDDNDFDATGYLTANQITLLDRQATEKDDAAWQEAQEEDTPEAYRRYLEAFPDGRHAEDARARLAALGPRLPPVPEDVRRAAAARERALGLTPPFRRLVEFRLAALGLEPGPVDGLFDERTRTAIYLYQQDHGLEATGYLDRATLASLALGAVLR
jgi:peptidoglycan hydrolase-like protein with peptidoglycan-binding domain